MRLFCRCICTGRMAFIFVRRVNNKAISENAYQFADKSRVSITMTQSERKTIWLPEGKVCTIPSCIS